MSDWYDEHRTSGDDPLVDALKPDGYTFEAMRSASGKLHLVYAPSHRRSDGPGYRTICGRTVEIPWVSVAAQRWYESEAERCSLCDGKLGPWATIRL